MYVKNKMTIDWNPEGEAEVTFDDRWLVVHSDPASECCLETSRYSYKDWLFKTPNNTGILVEFANYLFNRNGEIAQRFELFSDKYVDELRHFAGLGRATLVRVIMQEGNQ